jgi:hypothetical protein
MAHEIYWISSFQKVAPFTLRIAFNDGTSQIMDFRPVLKGELFGPLREPALFDQVRIDPEASGHPILTGVEPAPEQPRVAEHHQQRVAHAP